MTIVSLLSRRRRVLALCAATAALHFVTINWLGSRLGPQQSTAVKPAPSVMQAQLRLALPQRTASSAPPPELKPLDPAAAKPSVKPPARPARRTLRPAPQPQQSVVAEPAPQDSGALSDPLAGIGPALAAQPELAQPGAAPAPAAVQSPPASAPGAAPATPGASDKLAAEQPVPQSTRRYKVDLPPSAEFEMELKRTDANGTKWSGVAHMSWQTDGSRYKVGMEAGISMLVTRVNLLALGSEGEIDDAGIAPLKFTEKRRGRAQTATHFVRNDGRITFSASERSYPLLAGAQDKATVPFQLGAIGRADVNQFGSEIDILVGDEKDASIYRFLLVGEEELDTQLGRIVTWHLARPPKPGSYSARLDIWLAPGMNWFPVQIRNTEANGALTTQTITKITLSGNAGK
ncbi:hypothetical protein ASC94_25685 [Massilia sp. Root418]|jgi:hypothetical protein|uniref:DUF3108 domain-containing protein n=1 Tax=Massilia sp. Root418 TaxID=1736532 RepID=UPI0006F332E3|nr:DUF3108 domain-containing protein [Massilia sp. Root418]KQW87889.1 hypothetical protein ASC94_25685 [Massilia sp. Root418]